VNKHSLLFIALLSIVISCSNSESEQLYQPRNAPIIVEGPLGGMNFSLVTPDIFSIGSTQADEERYSNEGPSTQIELAAFQIMTTEVTQGMWNQIMTSSPFNANHGIGNNLPAYNVSWEDCNEFVTAINSLDNEYLYRLPTESEWEYAARAGGNSIRYWGNTRQSHLAIQFCIYSLNSSNKPKLVASRHPNALGLYDMLGNVYEWCEDNYINNYSRIPRDGTAYTGSGTFWNNKVLRGGSWETPLRNCRSTDRTSADATSISTDRGFRLVREPIQDQTIIEPCSGVGCSNPEFHREPIQDQTIIEPDTIEAEIEIVTNQLTAEPDSIETESEMNENQLPTELDTIQTASEQVVIASTPNAIKIIITQFENIGKNLFFSNLPAVSKRIFLQSLSRVNAKAIYRTPESTLEIARIIVDSTVNNVKRYAIPRTIISSNAIKEEFRIVVTEFSHLFEDTINIELTEIANNIEYDYNLITECWPEYFDYEILSIRQSNQISFILKISCTSEIANSNYIGNLEVQFLTQSDEKIYREPFSQRIIFPISIYSRMKPPTWFYWPLGALLLFIAFMLIEKLERTYRSKQLWERLHFIHLTDPSKKRIVDLSSFGRKAYIGLKDIELEGECEDIACIIGVDKYISYAKALNGHTITSNGARISGKLKIRYGSKFGIDNKWEFEIL